MSSTTFIDDEQLIDELRRYGETNLPTLSFSGSTRSRNKNQLNDSNRDLYIKKLNHYKAKEKAEKNPSKQYQKQLNKTQNSLSTSTRQDNNEDEDDELDNDVQIIEPDNDIVPLDANETQYEYIKVSDAYTSPLSQTRYSHGVYNDTTQNENNYESTSSNIHTSTQPTFNNGLNYVRLKDKIELDKTLSKYRSEINDILAQTSVKNRSVGGKLSNDDVIYTGTVFSNEVTSTTDHNPESATLYCPRPRSVFESIKSKFTQEKKLEPISSFNRIGARSAIGKISKEANKEKLSNGPSWLTRTLIPFISQSWIQLSKILPYLVLIIFTIISLQYFRVKFSNDSFSFFKQYFTSSNINPNRVEHYYCADIKDPQCLHTKLLVKDLIDYLRAKSGQIDCSTLIEQNFEQPPVIAIEFTEKCVHLNKIVNYLTNERRLIKNLAYKDKAIDSVLRAIMLNPHWNLRVLNASYVDTNQLDSVTYLMSTVSSKSLSCRFKELMHFLYVRLVMFCLLIFTLFLGYLIWKAVKSQRLERDQKFFSLIKQVTEHVEKQFEMSLLDPINIKPYIAISHVYDTLIEPSERASKKKVWNEVIKFIEDQESRIHLETQFIDGEETLVWKWVVPKHHESVKNFKFNKPDGIGLANSTMINQTDINLPQASEREFNKENNLEKNKNLSGWQGDAFNRSEKLAHSPTPCLKIRGMFDQATVETDPLFASKIHNDILKKCVNGVNDSILHISCDRKSKEGCVYVKCLTNEAAGRVYQALNGTWYNGKLLNVKFLRSDRYLERFPDSINYQTPLKMV